MGKNIVMALAGNPNCGKTSLFNALTGAKQHVGNWPGVTVEKKEGKYKSGDVNFRVVDLPGTYSLGAYSEDEVVARNFILDGEADVIVNVVDATNVERNLYLTTQILEINPNVVIALNMMDEAENKNIKINVNKLSERLGVPIIPIVAVKNKGLNELTNAIIKAADNKRKNVVSIDYGNYMKAELMNVQSELAACTEGVGYPPYWTAIKLFENDEKIIDIVKNKRCGNKVLNMVNEGVSRVTKSAGYEPEALIIDKKYEFISNITSDIIKRDEIYKETATDKIDKVITNRFLGIPIFAAIMFFVYQITMKFGNDFLGEKVGGAFEALGEWAGTVLPDNLFGRFVVEGIIGGMGSVLTFVPLILVLYLLISILEDSGYMARAAYVMDRLMTALGLHGKTAVSMIIGSGCNVAGIMSTRTLESKRDRMVAILINPFVSCGARYPVYALFAGAFFGDTKVGPFSGSGIVVFSLYVIGIIVAIVAGKVLSSTVFKGEPSYFVMELPPYRIPTVKSICTHMWEKASAFVKKAGTIIFGVVIVVFLLSNFPLGVEPGSAESILGRIGGLIAPIFKPAGFGTWQAGVSLITGILAKEAVVSTMGTIYAAGDEGLKLAASLKQVFTPLSAYAFMVMSLLYTPCAAALGAVKRETNSVKWTVFSAVYSFVIAWVFAVLIFQIGTLFGL